jgi:hypothetical protein
MDEKHREENNYSHNCVACHADGKKPAIPIMKPYGRGETGG